MKVTFLIIGCMLLVNCSNSNKDQEEFMTRQNYWNVHTLNADSIVSTSEYIKFNKNGTAIHAFLRNEGKEMREMNTEGVGHLNTRWSYSGVDSTLVLFGKNYKLLRTNTDTMVVKVDENRVLYFVLSEREKSFFESC